MAPVVAASVGALSKPIGAPQSIGQTEWSQRAAHLGLQYRRGIDGRRLHAWQNERVTCRGGEPEIRRRRQGVAGGSHGLDVCSWHFSQAAAAVRIGIAARVI